MRQATVQANLDQLCVFVTKDLFILCAACCDHSLPLAKLLRHVRRHTGQACLVADRLDDDERELTRRCLLSMRDACIVVLNARGGSGCWLDKVVPDLATALCAVRPPGPTPRNRPQED